MPRFLYLIALLLSLTASAQKTTYIPLYLQDATTNDGAQFSWAKTAQSENFTLIWGNTVGTDPANYTADPDLAFNPVAILDTMEMLYASFKTLGFLDDAPGANLAQYKIPVVMLNTWGATGAMGWAYGGDADGVIGAFWSHPLSMHDGHTAAHELVHSLQAQCNIDYRAQHGLGGAWDHAGIFWETHANFMRNQIYPLDVTAWGMDVFHVESWGSWKNTYENYALLMGIQESEGLPMVDTLWRKSYSWEYPLQAYKRIAGYSQARFNDSLYHYARRMATRDFPTHGWGAHMRAWRQDDLMNWMPSVQSCWNIPQSTPDTDGLYEMPIEQAPEEYGYNIVPLYQHPDSCAVILRFRGHTDLNTHAGWRYGFVTAHPDGTISRYSETYADADKEISFSLQGDETNMYLVVMGAPADSITTTPDNDTWYGYPKHFRFPYALYIRGGVPEGYQAPQEFRAQLKFGGALHSNGGGWVANSASVSPLVYVGSSAMVLGYANLGGNARVEGTAIVRDAIMTGNAKATGNALILGGTYTNNAVVGGSAVTENVIMSGNARVHMRARVSNYTLSGSVEVGGDVLVYNTAGNCDSGVYYRMTNYYEDNLLECDGRTASHPQNADVNNVYQPFNITEMGIACNCATLPDCLTATGTGVLQAGEDGMLLVPNPAHDLVVVRATGAGVSGMEVVIINAVGSRVMQASATGSACHMDISRLSAGMYGVLVSVNGQEPVVKKLMVR